LKKCINSKILSFDSGWRKPAFNASEFQTKCERKLSARPGTHFEQRRKLTDAKDKKINTGTFFPV
jgi:hypothetical protein